RPAGGRFIAALRGEAGALPRRGRIARCRRSCRGEDAVAALTLAGLEGFHVTLAQMELADPEEPVGAGEGVVGWTLAPCPALLRHAVHRQDPHLAEAMTEGDPVARLREDLDAIDRALEIAGTGTVICVERAARDPWRRLDRRREGPV
ncbi:MAG: hypothetical protein ACK559_27310, partial [bacterium]